MKRTSVAAFAEQAIAHSANRLISVPSLVSSIRQAMPACEHTDDELAHLVSVIAVSKGLSLSFIRPVGFEPVD